MEKYLGQKTVNIDNTEFKNFTTTDWALYFIESYSQIDGAHHKQWVLDQVARILHGNKIIVKLAKWDNGEEEFRVSLHPTPTKKYKKWVKEYQNGENGPNTYGYDEGIAP